MVATLSFPTFDLDEDQVEIGRTGRLLCTNSNKASISTSETCCGDTW